MAAALCPCPLGCSGNIGSLEQHIDTSCSHLLFGESYTLRVLYGGITTWTSQLRISFVAGGKRSLCFHLYCSASPTSLFRCWLRKVLCIYSWASRWAKRFRGARDYHRGQYGRDLQKLHKIILILYNIARSTKTRSHQANQSSTRIANQLCAMIIPFVKTTVRQCLHHSHLLDKTTTNTRWYDGEVILSAEIKT